MIVYLNPVWQSYACDPEHSKGRIFKERKSQYRSEYQRDRDRIIHSTAFRRLKGKTQVFISHEGDHYRTRLTHSLEVAQIARTLARVFGVNEDLTEALALAHDLGHPPFGHSGEKTLQACMQEYGGFDHNAQTLRIVTRLEHHYMEFHGLNLTWESLEGIVKHNGPVLSNKDDDVDLAWAIKDYEHYKALDLSHYASMEAQIAAISDDIAYNNHDIDDGLQANLFSIHQLCDQVPMVRQAINRFLKQHADRIKKDSVFGSVIYSDLPFLVYQLIRELIGDMVRDVIQETQQQIKQFKIRSINDIRSHKETIVRFSTPCLKQQSLLRHFLKQNMYHHYKVNQRMSYASRIITKLFHLYFKEPGLLPFSCFEQKKEKKARLICDYIAGMTDRFALDQYQKLF